MNVKVREANPLTQLLIGVVNRPDGGFAILRKTCLPIMHYAVEVIRDLLTVYRAVTVLVEIVLLAWSWRQIDTVRTSHLRSTFLSIFETFEAFFQ